MVLCHQTQWLTYLSWETCFRQLEQMSSGLTEQKMLVWGSANMGMPELGIEFILHHFCFSQISRGVSLQHHVLLREGGGRETECAHLLIHTLHTAAALERVT